MTITRIKANATGIVFGTKKIDIKDAVVRIKDGSSPQNSIDVKIGEGNITYTENKNLEYVMDRGLLDQVRRGDQAPMDVSIDFQWEFLKAVTSSGGVPTVEDAVKQRGNASDWTSTDGNSCNPYSVDIEIYNAPGCGGNQDEILTIPDFRYESLDHDLRDGTVSMSGRANAEEVSISRVANSSGSP